MSVFKGGQNFILHRIASLTSLTSAVYPRMDRGHRKLNQRLSDHESNASQFTQLWALFLDGKSAVILIWYFKMHVYIKHVIYNLRSLKLYCDYKYTRPYMINRVSGLKQLWLQVNGHAWFHLHGLRWPVRNGEGAKNSKWKYMFPAGFEPTPCQSTTDKSAL